MGRVNVGGKKGMDGMFDFPLSIQTTEPTPIKEGHIWINSSVAANITTVKIVEAVTVGETNGTLMLVVGDLSYYNANISQDKKLVSGGNAMQLSIVNSTLDAADWLVSNPSDGSTIKLRRPMAYSKLGDVLDVETASMWNGSSWVTLCTKGHYVVVTPSSQSNIDIYNITGDSLSFNSTVTGSGYQYNKIHYTNDGRYAWGEIYGGIAKRVGDIYNTLFTPPSSIVATTDGLTYNKVTYSSALSGDGSTLAVLYYYAGVSSQYNFMVVTYINNGTTFVKSQELKVVYAQVANLNWCRIIISDDANVIIFTYKTDAYYHTIRNIFKVNGSYVVSQAAGSYVGPPSLNWYTHYYWKIVGNKLYMVAGVKNGTTEYYGYTSSNIDYAAQTISGTVFDLQVAAVGNLPSLSDNNYSYCSNTGMIFAVLAVAGSPWFKIHGYDTINKKEYIGTFPITLYSNSAFKGLSVNLTGDRIAMLVQPTGTGNTFLYWFDVEKDDVANTITLTTLQSSIYYSSAPINCDICPR